MPLCLLSSSLLVRIYSNSIFISFSLTAQLYIFSYFTYIYIHSYGQASFFSHTLLSLFRLFHLSVSLIFPSPKGAKDGFVRCILNERFLWPLERTARNSKFVVIIGNKNRPHLRELHSEKSKIFYYHSNSTQGHLNYFIHI